MNNQDEYLDYLSNQADEALQAIQDLLGRENQLVGRVRFPRGFIRRVDTLRAQLPDIGTEVQRRNVCYALIMTDVLRWLAIRTDLSGTALSMVVKEGIAVLGAICEWLTKEATRGYASRRSYIQRTENLVDRNIITSNLKNELDWIWEIRCNEHIHQVDNLEHEMYSRQDYNRALRAYNELRLSLLN